MLNLVFLLVELALAKKVIDCFVVLRVYLDQCLVYTDKTPTISRNWPSILYSQPLDLRCSAALNTSFTARGIMPAVASVWEIGVLDTSRLDGGKSAPIRLP